ncbi:MAG: homoserine O-acetyltransferase [Microbacterium sp.]|uniref:homoserine O-acetyltransferase MetX n=1 Tax=Microbacterium sp. TaxID=51671 RepID=UPI0039E49FF9
MRALVDEVASTPDPGESGAAHATAGTCELGELPLESGATLPAASLFFEAYGHLDAQASNAVLLFHGLSADSHLASGSHDATPGWWEQVVGPGRGVDTDEWFVVCANVLGGCFGSTGPRTLAPDGRLWAADFPEVSIRDQAAAAARLGPLLGVRRWAAVIGPSYGGMHALEFAVTYGDLVERSAVIAAPPLTTAEQVASNTLQLALVTSEPEFRAGAHQGRPLAGLQLARRLGMLAYRGETELDDRFGRTEQDDGSGRFAVDSYLDHGARKFAERFDPNSYVTLVTSKNTHDVGRGRGSARRALETVRHPTLVIGIDSDQLFPLRQQEFIARHIPSSVTGDRPLVLESAHGHDSFLIEQEWVGIQLSKLLHDSS